MHLVIAMTNVFKIRYNKETHVYRTEVAADKRSLLMQFRAVAEELAAKRRKEREGEHQRRKSMWGGGDVSHISTSKIMLSLTTLPRSETLTRFLLICLPCPTSSQD